MDPRLMSAFLEHLGRAIYGGIYEPDSALADSSRFRSDVVREMQELKCPIMRYPGGNFVSGYDWLHGAGPKKDRPEVLERAWNSIETNQFGTNEFIEWCNLVGTEPLLATNLGTGTPETSAALVEYCNVEKGTRWSDLRREHGYEQPHKVKSHQSGSGCGSTNGTSGTEPAQGSIRTDRERLRRRCLRRSATLRTRCSWVAW